MCVTNDILSVTNASIVYTFVYFTELFKLFYGYLFISFYIICVVIIRLIQLSFSGKRSKACLSLAVASYISMYPIMLVVPTAIFIARVSDSYCKMPS